MKTTRTNRTPIDRIFSASRAGGTALLLLLLLVSLPAAAEEDEWTISGSIGAEARWFLDDPAHPGQLDGAQASLLFEPEFRWRSGNRAHQVKVAPFLRLDAEDDERTHFDLREGFYRYVGSDWELLAGVNKVYWGVTESRHLVDVINQTDALEDIDEEDKLGQPMVQFALSRDWGRLEVYSLLGFRQREFPGLSGRLRTPFVVDGGDAQYESGAEDTRVDWAARWTHVIGDWDLGLHAFHGTGREPVLALDPSLGRVVPHYDLTNQIGADVQYTREAWLWKLETILREGQGDTFGAFVGGFEYTFYQLGDSAADLGVLVELLYDGRDASAPFTLFDDDTFVGARLALNDIQDSSILLGAVIDNDDGSVALFLEGERRIGQRWSLELEGRFFLDVDPTGELAVVDRDSFVTLRGTWHF